MANPIIHPPGVSAAQFDAMVAMMTPIVITMTPEEGQLIELPDTTQEIILNLEPATALNAVTLELPTNAAPREGQRIFVASTMQIDQLTATGPTPVNGAVTMFNPGDNYVYFQNKGQTWSRLIG